MVYLDYSATTPVLSEVLESYVRVTNEFIANANSMHNLGVKSKELYMKATKQIADILNILPSEIIYTSGASESNSTAIKGIAFKYKNRGKHIITSKLEHKSILDVMDFLSKNGFEIEYVKLNKNGIVDLNDLESKIRKDTILVSICSVNSEIGFKQPLKAIKQVIKKKNNLTFFHSDMTQALGKTSFNLSDVDLASFSAHKVYAPKGIGILYKKNNIEIEPLIYGVTSNTPYRGGTPMLPLVVSFSKAIRIAYENLEENIKKEEKLKTKLINALKEYEIVINSNNECVPSIINFSLIRIKSETFIHALEKDEIYVSTNTACSSGDESTILKYLTNDKNISTTSIRVSIGPYTTNEEINKFIESFGENYRSLIYKL